VGRAQSHLHMYNPLPSLSFYNRLLFWRWDGTRLAQHLWHARRRWRLRCTYAHIYWVLVSISITRPEEIIPSSPAHGATTLDVTHGLETRGWTKSLFGLLVGTVCQPEITVMLRDAKTVNTPAGVVAWVRGCCWRIWCMCLDSVMPQQHARRKKRL
jgi:hypothetical protein